MSIVITFLIASPIIGALCAWIAIDEHYDLTGHLTRRPTVRRLINRINTYLNQPNP